MSTLIEIALSCLNIPYKWGGENPVSGLDCSGLVCWILKCSGMMKHHDPKLSAQELFDKYSPVGIQGRFVPGSLAFYGPDAKSIEHVGFCLDDRYMVEAGGGDHTVLLPQDAAAKGACVRISPIKQRLDFLCVLKPDYSAIGITI